MLAAVSQPAAFAKAAAPASGTTDAVYTFIKSRAGEKNARLYTPLIKEEARRFKLPPLLVAKVINRESTFRQFVSNGYCVGLMQVARFHFKKGENPFKARDNIRAGCRELSSCFGRFRNWPQALTAYNYGPNHPVTRGIGTSGYARQVLAGR